MNRQAQHKIRVSNITAVSPQNKAIYEAGKSFIVESISTGREFCKYMISFSTGAIPVYLGLLKFILPDKKVLSSLEGLLVFVPACVFLIAAIIFTCGYWPKIEKINLEIMQMIEETRLKVIHRQKSFTIAGLYGFFLGILSSIAIIGYFICKQ